MTYPQRYGRLGRVGAKNKMIPGGLWTAHIERESLREHPTM